MLFDFECERGHRTEHDVDRSVRSVVCACGKQAARQFSVPHVNGIVKVPMRERGVPLNRMVEAHDTILYEAEKAHVEPPDTLKMAKAQAAAIRKHRPDLVTGGR